MINILTADMLNLDRLSQNTPQQQVKAGLEDYAEGRVTIETVGQSSARVQVRDFKTNRPYLVSLWLNGRQLAMTCTCRDSYQWYLCRHRIAAIAALRDHLKKNPPKLWQAVLEQAAQAPARRSSTSYGPIVFSLQERGNGWGVTPYSLAARYFGAHQLGDHEAIASAIAEQGLSGQARPIRSRINRQSYPAATETELAAVNLAVGNPYMMSGYSYGREAVFYEPVLSLLPGCLVYTGDEGDPLSERITVLPELGTLSAELSETKKGLKLSAQVVAGAHALPLGRKETAVVVNDPLWMLIGGTLVQVKSTDGLAAALLEYPELVIPPEDQEVFLEKHLLPLTGQLDIRGDMLQWIDIAADAAPRLYLSEAAEGLQAELRFAYGEHELHYDKRLPETATKRQPGTAQLARITRQPAREQELWQGLGSYGLKRSTEPSVWLVKKTVHPIDFLMHQVPKLVEDGYAIYGEEELTLARVNRNKPTISFKVTSGIDWFDVKAVVNYGDLAVPLKAIRQAIKKREKYIKLADGTMGAIPEEWLARYRHMLALGDDNGETLRFAPQHITMIDQLLGEADRAQVDEAFEQRREKLRGFERIVPQPLPTTFKGELRPYQKFGYDWLHFLREYNFGGCLADDMGTGKTIQTLAFIESLYEKENDAPATLVVMPRSLLFNWQREAEKFTPDLAVYVHADQGRITDPQEFAQYDLVLTTYGTMLRDIAALRTYQFNYAILDESQAIKNPVAETSKAARLLNAKHRLVLTGTPIENSTGELWSQFAFLNPGLLGDISYFREEFINPIERQQNQDAAQFLRKMVFPFILRRTKDQVAADLPPRSEEVVMCDMEPAQRKLYDKQRDYYRAQLLGMIDDDGMNDARMKILEGLLRLRQISIHPRLVDAKFKGNSGKFDLLLDTLDTLRAEGHRALVFSQFVQMLTLVREALDERGIPYCYLDGQTRDRQGEVDRFQNDDTVPFFLISLKAGGVGLNLTAADYVIHIDPWWNPAVEQQATDRTHRIGQDKPVFVYKLIARDTVEEKILQLQAHKRELVEQVIGAEGGVFKALTREDIEILFS